VNGKQYYKDGELQKTGWTVIDGNTYYLDTENRIRGYRNHDAGPRWSNGRSTLRL
jgi:glucan-binding YG repeat protein